jgi:hypothetical protein
LITAASFAWGDVAVASFLRAANPVLLFVGIDPRPQGGRTQPSVEYQAT